MCGTVQLLVDFIIIGQIYFFQKETKIKGYIKVDKTEKPEEGNLWLFKRICFEYVCWICDFSNLF